MRCGRGSFFKIGDRADWSYLLPKRLGARALRARGQGDRRRLQPRRGDARALPGQVMRRALLLAGLLALAVPAPAGAATVELMVVGKERVLREAAPVKLEVAVGAGRRAALRGRPRDAAVGARRARGCALRLQDYGSCGRSPRDAGALYVTQIGSDRRARPGRLGLQGRAPGGDDRRGRSLGAVRARRRLRAGRAGAVVLVRPGPRRGVPADARGVARPVDGRAGRDAARSRCAAMTTAGAACRWRGRRCGSARRRRSPTRAASRRSPRRRAARPG